MLGLGLANNGLAQIRINNVNLRTYFFNSPHIYIYCWSLGYPQYLLLYWAVEPYVFMKPHLEGFARASAQEGHAHAQAIGRRALLSQE